MAYQKTTWINKQTPLNQSNMNKIEQGIYDAHEAVTYLEYNIGENISDINNLKQAMETISPQGTHISSMPPPDKNKIWVNTSIDNFIRVDGSLWTWVLREDNPIITLNQTYNVKTNEAYRFILFDENNFPTLDAISNADGTLTFEYYSMEGTQLFGVRVTLAPLDSTTIKVVGFDTSIGEVSNKYSFMAHSLEVIE
jgi:hypothetical protein